MGAASAVTSHQIYPLVRREPVGHVETTNVDARLRTSIVSVADRLQAIRNWVYLTIELFGFLVDGRQLLHQARPSVAGEPHFLARLRRRRDDHVVYSQCQ